MAKTVALAGPQKPFPVFQKQRVAFDVDPEGIRLAVNRPRLARGRVIEQEIKLVLDTIGPHDVDILCIRDPSYACDQVRSDGIADVQPFGFAARRRDHS